MAESNIGNQLSSAMGAAEADYKHYNNKDADVRKKILMISSNIYISIAAIAFVAYLLFILNPFYLLFLLLIPIAERYLRVIEKKKLVELENIMRKASETKKLTFKNKTIDLTK